MSKHTPGPWTIPTRDSGITVNAGSGIVAEVYAVDVGHTQAANARLIAAAPDLLEALIRMVAHYGHLDSNNTHPDTALNTAWAAIAKAGL